MKAAPACASLLLFAASTLFAQEIKFPTPQKEHEWLQQFVGNWSTDSEGSMGPGQPTMKCQGTMSCRMLGGFWILSELKSEMMASSSSDTTPRQRSTLARGSTR
jgi:hypothetical protein